MGRNASANTWRVLLLDSYDSFTNNLAQLIRASTNVPADIYIVKNDTISKEKLLEILTSIDAVVVGPGPGSPANPADVGIITALWELTEDHMIPVFGVCLGMQSLCLAHGGTLHRLRAPQHGRLTPIRHDGTDIFEGVNSDCIGVRYHSLHVTPSDEIRPLAWATDVDDGEVLMAARHVSKPFWGVQYHPESICSDKDAAAPMASFFVLARKWLQKHRRYQRLNAFPRWFAGVSHQYPVQSSLSRIAPSTSEAKIQVQTSLIEQSTLSAPHIAEFLGVTDGHTDFVMLDSAATPGRFSIIAALTPDSPRIQHLCGDNFVTVAIDGAVQRESLLGSTIWNWLESFMRSRQVARDGAPEIPFWGGLIGSFSYEAGVEVLDIQPLLAEDRPSDVNLVFVQRSVVLDNQTSHIYVQSIRENDALWVSETRQRLSVFHKELDEPIKHDGTLHIQRGDEYKKQVRQCQEFLAAGETYELCFTTAATVHLQPTDTAHHKRSWNFYRRLRARNPAPYAAYMRLGSMTFVGSSPERFLSWDRNGRAELRPMKGTVKKLPDGSVTRAQAEKVLRTDKEMAENLMIVDLIRHDLHGRAAADSVTVSQLMSVEEYERVFQLVSVIEGRVEQHRAFDLLRTSLPPGSMTGAPKKRSVEILQRLECRSRGMYSGVVGYWCAGGGADWSVVIRSAVNTGKVTEDGEDIWSIGAGGAITILSDPQEEFEEMETKLASVLSALG
ncbi:para-aminobenzoic acid synthetase [Auriculariales sp. MPI-PUGE-AT-0066]|nr:para-aminobenzoic acid synthetase [Auriculariales sp. MPI-PUGE-AT-0066]